MTKIINDSFLKTLRREATPYTPVWMMRQAGRYLPEYRASRKTAGSFLELCKNKDFATEVTLQPLDRYPYLRCRYFIFRYINYSRCDGIRTIILWTGKDQNLKDPCKMKKQVQKLDIPDVDEKLHYVFEAVRSIKKALNQRVPLIGFSGSPWTLATYMVEGKGGTDFLNIKKMLYARPDLMKPYFEDKY